MDEELNYLINTFGVGVDRPDDLPEPEADDDN